MRTLTLLCLILGISLMACVMVILFCVTSLLMVHRRIGLPMILCLLSLEALTNKFEAMRIFARCMRGFYFFLTIVIVAQISWLSSVAPKKIVLAQKNRGAPRDFVRS